MTGNEPRASWDDERLIAAFAARASRARTPDDLVGVTRATLRARPAPAVPWRVLLAPAAVLVLAIGAIAGGMAVIESQRDPSGLVTASPPVSWAGREAVGLPVISVQDAIAIRDAGVDDREIAVHGWFSPIAPLECPVTPATSPVQPVCPDQYVVLMAEPESVVTVEENGFSGGRPTGPSIQVDLDDLDVAWEPGLPDIGPAPPVEIAVVGHFDDRRSAACPAEVESACRDRLVVDRVDWVNGEAQPTSLLDLDEGHGRSYDEAQAVIDLVRPGVTILSAVHVDGNVGLRRIEPALAARGSSLIQADAVWLVRVLAAGQFATYLYVDATADLYQLTADRPMIMAPLTGGETDPASPSATPEVRATFTFELSGVEDRPVPIDVLDLTGLVAEARDATTKERSQSSDIPRPGTLAIRNLVPDTVLVTWIGSVCDAHPELQVGAHVPDGPPRVLYLTDHRPGCDAMGIGRGIVVRFSIDVDAGDLTGIEEVHLVEPPP
jgi:hypothetical protein